MPADLNSERLTSASSVLMDAVEVVDAVETRVLYRINDEEDWEVSAELVGRLAVFVQNARENVGWITESVDKIERSLHALLAVADYGSADDVPFDKRGKATNDWDAFWRENVSDALGIQRPGGAYGPELAARIAAKVAADA